MECVVAVARRGFKVGPFIAEPAEEAGARMAIFLWGPATVGKTTFAATAPGNKLWLSFGDNEHMSIASRRDVHVLKLYDLSVNELFKHALSDDPFGLDKALAENDSIQTVVADSITALAFRALQKAIADGVGRGKDFHPSMMLPGISAYGGRNGVVLEVLTGLLRVTAKHGVHFIGTAHEADPHTKKDDKGNDIIDYVTVMLGGQLVNGMSFRWSEIWYLSQDSNAEGRRRLAIRPTRLRKPMKTRMFTSAGEKEFVLKYDALKPDKGQMTIAKWYEQWESGGYEKLEVPK
jgi:hypothetical protein